MVLKIAQLFQVFVWQIQDEQAEDDAAYRGICQIAIENPNIDDIEQMPDASPDEDHADDDSDIVSEIAYEMTSDKHRFFIIVYPLYHADTLDTPFRTRKKAAK